MDNYGEYYNIGQLIVSHLRGELSVDEQEKLNAWRKHSEENERLFSKLTDEAFLLEELPAMGPGTGKRQEQRSGKE